MKALRHDPIIPLAVFVGGGLLALFGAVESRTDPARLPGGRAAHGPAEFPAIFEQDPLLRPVPRDAKTGEDGHLLVPPPPFSEDIFPCSECHKERKTNPRVRRLKEVHDEMTLQHGGEKRWCYDCHNPENQDTLRLAGGTVVEFGESYRLCGQCHGEIYRDWRDGIHGRRTGYWDGPKQYLLCAHCHDPHSPRFKPLPPLPPPTRPEFSGR